MPYVSAKYVAPSVMDPPDGPKRVAATDDLGRVWYLTEDSQVGDWLDYIANGGTIDPLEEPE